MFVVFDMVQVGLLGGVVGSRATHTDDECAWIRAIRSVSQMRDGAVSTRSESRDTASLTLISDEKLKSARRSCLVADSVKELVGCYLRDRHVDFR